MPTRAVRLLIASTRQAGKEAKGAVSTETHEGTPLKSKLVLLDGDGITGAEGVSVRSRDELMTDPKTLKAFIDYGVANFPAERYDLILWDHGEGPASGYGIDENAGLTGDGDPKMMTFPQIVDALSDNAVTTNDADGDGKLDKFDLIDFDACTLCTFKRLTRE